jgi:hypothetical protein
MVFGEQLNELEAIALAQPLPNGPTRERAAFTRHPKGPLARRFIAGFASTGPTRSRFIGIFLFRG